eukprot:1159844-Pelagomonas_calceolata.AAC.7
MAELSRPRSGMDFPTDITGIIADMLLEQKSLTLVGVRGYAEATELVMEQGIHGMAWRNAFPMHMSWTSPGTLPSACWWATLLLPPSVHCFLAENSNKETD